MHSLEALRARFCRVDPISDFPVVEDLRADMLGFAAAHPDAVAHRVVGESRTGDPIDLFTFGDGALDVVIAGGVHPNEPIGFRTIQELARRALAPDIADRLDVTWHVIPCVDPDGTRLNESWFADPSDRRRYFAGFYRPAPTEQVEWSFPFHYKDVAFDGAIPETRALMAVFDEVEPDLFVGLHNAELGGVYFYLNSDDTMLAQSLRAIPGEFGLPLDVGEPESAEIEEILPAVYRAPSARDRYDFLQVRGLDPARELSGAGSADYLERYASATLVAELPYWTHPDAADPSPSAQRYRDVLARKAADLEELHRFLSSAFARVEAELTIDSPFLRASRAFIPAMGSAADAERVRAGDPAVDRPASVAEVFSNREVVRTFRLRFGGIFRRALEAEVTAGTATRTVREVHAAVTAWFESWNAQEAREDLRAAPIENLVGVQLAAILAAIDALGGVGRSR